MSDAAVIDLADLWRRSLEHLQHELTGAAQRTWLAETEPVGFSHGTVYLAAPHPFAREQLDLRYGDTLRSALSHAAGESVEVVITVRAAPAPEASQSPDASAPSDADRSPADGPALEPRAARSEQGSEPGPEAFPSQQTAGPPLNDKYTFDRFVIGASNRFAHAAAFAVAEAPAKAYNPLFVYGGAGLGKTHLLQAVGHYAVNLYPRLRVRYVTSEQFTNEFIDAISNGRQVPFQRRYRDVEVLLIDDVQFLATRERTQEEFFHTFNALHNAEKQIVISSDRPPKQMGQLEERLRTRFEWGLITDIQPPDLETRLAILRKKSAQEHLHVPPEVLELIANRISSNIRELEGALIRVTAFASLQGTEPTLGLAQTVLKDLFPETSTNEVSVSLIMSETARYFGMTVEELCSSSRTRQLVNARQVAMYLARELTDLSLPKIGDAFGGRDHSTVMHANRKVAGLMKERHALYDQVQELTSRIKTSAQSAG
ncbi:chromosomal replication initiator protein DnaA [Egibacter rhizosphaerae]|uniref:Chromosomal replication initiator protein DnaA n=2 Tax=Egibacter rhizosphaerae TaxID=1670831 RepID=A0A411YFP3_9ACTN|nr:chromosomal replication initiator protein DnaA [Egibacter rhizosphaerae]QBI19999.1 chromosomal replication initiator protein DnaA [Egibacter rhizosphaerae]